MNELIYMLLQQARYMNFNDFRHNVLLGDIKINDNIDDNQYQYPLIFLEGVLLDVKKVSILIDELGADIKLKNHAGRTPFQVSCLNGSDEYQSTRELFLSRYNENPNQIVTSWSPLNNKTHKRQLAMHIIDHVNTIKLLIKYGLDIYTLPSDKMSSDAYKDYIPTQIYNKNFWKWQPSYASIYEALDTYKVDICSKDNLSNTTLHYASLYCNAGMIETLALLQGDNFDANVKNNAGETPLDFAKAAGNVDNVKTLISLGAKLS